MSNNKARSLSTLIAFSVNKYNVQSTWPATRIAKVIWVQRLYSSEIKNITNSGSKRNPTHKSVSASERNKILEGGWMHDPLEWAATITALQNVKVIARIALEPTRNHNEWFPCKGAMHSNACILWFSPSRTMSMFRFGFLLCRKEFFLNIITLTSESSFSVMYVSHWAA